MFNRRSVERFEDSGLVFRTDWLKTPLSGVFFYQSIRKKNRNAVYR